jgi:hypothetical protein
VKIMMVYVILSALRHEICLSFSLRDPTQTNETIY